VCLFLQRDTRILRTYTIKRTSQKSIQVNIGGVVDGVVDCPFYFFLFTFFPDLNVAGVVFDIFIRQSDKN
jgi:hypothetical protein